MPRDHDKGQRSEESAERGSSPSESITGAPEIPGRELNGNGGFGGPFFFLLV